MTAIPCSHAIAAMQKVKIHPEDYVYAFFKKPMYCETYKHIIFPVPGPDHWPHTPGDDISPPVFEKRTEKKLPGGKACLRCQLKRILLGLVQ